MSSKIDRHGYIDIRLEAWKTNIRFDHPIDRDIATISGISINSLFRGLFILNGYDEATKRSLPGGIKCWDELLSVIYTTLPYHLTIFEFIARVRVLGEDYLHRRIEYAEKSIISESHESVSNLLYGALMFLHTWIANFNEYITESHLMLLRRGIITLGNLGIRCIVGKKKNIDSCGDVYRRLEVLIDIVSRERTILTSGVFPTISSYHEYQQLAHLSIYDPILYDFLSKESVYSNVGKFQYLYHHRDYYQHDRCSTSPTIPRYEGSWDEQSSSSSIQDLVAAKDNPKFKVEIFGGNSLYDMSDSDEDDDGSNSASRQPMPRIPVGTSLIEAPITMGFEPCNDPDIWSYDILELARQLTLIDHGLFCAIPLFSLIGTDWTNPRHTMSAVAYKRYSDRFNTLSLWATTCILREDQIDVRVARYAQIIELSSQLLQLGNYHASIALFTSLKQGCVVRLELTMRKLNKKTKEMFNSLQKKLSEDKNYASYRIEMDKKVSQLTDIGEWTGRGKDKTALSNITSKLQDIPAVVPYLGIFTSDLVATHDGNTDHLPEAPHLINIHKFVLIAKSVQSIAKLQHLQYNYEHVRFIAASWNQLMKSYSKLTARQSKQVGDNLFNRSMALESPEMIEYELNQNNGYVDEDEEVGEAAGNAGVDEEVGELEQSTSIKKKKLFSMKKIFSMKKLFSKKQPKVDDSI